MYSTPCKRAAGVLLVRCVRRGYTEHLRAACASGLERLGAHPHIASLHHSRHSPSEHAPGVLLTGSTLGWLRPTWRLEVAIVALWSLSASGLTVATFVAEVCASRCGIDGAWGGHVGRVPRVPARDTCTHTHAPGTPPSRFPCARAAKRALTSLPDRQAPAADKWTYLSSCAWALLGCGCWVHTVHRGGSMLK